MLVVVYCVMCVLCNVVTGQHCTALHRVRGHKNSLPSPLHTHITHGLTWSHVPSQHLGLTTTPPITQATGAALLGSLCQSVLIFVYEINAVKTLAKMAKFGRSWERNELIRNATATVYHSPVHH